MVSEIRNILGSSNANIAVSRMNGSEKSWVGRTDLGLNPGKPMALINEHGLCSLLLRSSKPVVKAFKR